MLLRLLMCVSVGAAGQGLHTMTVGLQIPIRWMAPEVLSGQPQYFYASDVWSMGVVVWQLLTRHAEPYPDVPDMMAVVHGYAAHAGSCAARGSRDTEHANCSWHSR